MEFSTIIDQEKKVETKIIVYNNDLRLINEKLSKENTELKRLNTELKKINAEQKKIIAEQKGIIAEQKKESEKKDQIIKQQNKLIARYKNDSYVSQQELNKLNKEKIILENLVKSKENLIAEKEKEIQKRQNEINEKEDTIKSKQTNIDKLNKQVEKKEKLVDTYAKNSLKATYKYREGTKREIEAELDDVGFHKGRRVKTIDISFVVSDKMIPDTEARLVTLELLNSKYELVSPEYRRDVSVENYKGNATLIIRTRLQSDTYILRISHNGQEILRKSFTIK